MWFTPPFQCPEAVLFDNNGKNVGTHYAGPTWESTDGSKVGAKRLRGVKATEPNAVPWLLAVAVSHEGNGIFSDINNIQRLNTTGGVEPSTKADASNEGRIVWVPYTATYYFYKAGKQ